MGYCVALPGSGDMASLGASEFSEGVSAAAGKAAIATAAIRNARGPVSLEVCSGCGDDCRPVVDGAPVDLTPGATQALRVRVAEWGDEAGLTF